MGAGLSELRQRGGLRRCRERQVSTGSFGWAVAFGKTAMSCDFMKNNFTKVVVRKLKAPLVQQLCLVERSSH